jgi:hypothetical protein
VQRAAAEGCGIDGIREKARSHGLNQSLEPGDHMERIREMLTWLNK